LIMSWQMMSSSSMLILSDQRSKTGGMPPTNEN
jgi:hypothetical protein